MLLYKMSQNLTYLLYLFISLHSSCAEVFDFISQACFTWGVNTLRVPLIQNVLCSWQVLGWRGFLEAVILISLFTLLISPPSSHPICLPDILCSGGWWRVIMQVGWKILTSLFHCHVRCTLSHAGVLMCFLFLTFISFSSLPWASLSFISPYFPFYTPRSTCRRELSPLLFLRSRCSGRDSQCSAICGDRWRSGTAGFHRHLRPHRHHLVLRPTER